MDDDCCYLDGTPETFAKSCDVLLRLDDGSELPAHSQVLARLSNVCASMLDDGPLSGASTSKKTTLPLSDCSKATAINLLAVIYSAQPTQHIESDSAMALASLAHKLDMKVCCISSSRIRQWRLKQSQQEIVHVRPCMHHDLAKIVCRLL